MMKFMYALLMAGVITTPAVAEETTPNTMGNGSIPAYYPRMGTDTGKRT